MNEPPADHSATPEGDREPLEPPQLIAHRGYAARFPENTLAALAAAVEAGARWLEFDVQLTRDRVPVLLHDPTLARTAGRPESILKLDAASAAGIGVGEPNRFGGAFDGERLPLLTQAVAALGGWPGVRAFVEIKRHSLAAFGLETTVARVLEDLAPELERSVVISFNAEAVAAARRIAGCEIGWVLRAWDEPSRRVADALEPQYLFVNHLRLPPAPAALWPGPWRWACYEVTDPELARRLARRGVALIETMAVAEMVAALGAPVRAEVPGG